MDEKIPVNLRLDLPMTNYKEVENTFALLKEANPTAKFNVKSHWEANKIVVLEFRLDDTAIYSRNFRTNTVYDLRTLEHKHFSLDP